MPDPQLLTNVLDRLDKPRRSGNGHSALCPAHPDTEPSMSVKVGDNGAIVFNCHRGCTTEEIVAAIGLNMSDLWPDKKRERDDTKREFVDAYDYVDAEGTLLFQVTKWMKDGKKTFTQRRPLPGGKWEYSTTGINKPIYRWPNINTAIKNGDPIYIAEGEKDVHTLEQLGLAATCNPGGALAWLPKHTTQLTGATHVFIVADNDAVGYRHAQNVATELNDIDIPTTILASPNYKDVTDHIESGEPLSTLTEPEITEKNLDEYRELLNELKTITTKDWDISRKLDRARAYIDQHQHTAPDTGKLVRWDDFLKEAIEPYDWIIPGLLERQDRVIVVAAEGVGKTMLARQIALTAAAGLHPFTNAPMEPIRTLFVDLENPERIIRRTSAKIMEAIQLVKPTYKMEAHLYTKPNGINILKAQDRAQLEHIIQQTQPDLICLGPLYKTYLDPGGRTSESITTETAMHLDYLRTTYNCALWLEHHAPLGNDTTRQLRPFGSSVWSRWPEFGLALEPDPTTPHKYHLNHFRGARDTRDWPQTLTRGTLFPFDPQWA